MAVTFAALDNKRGVAAEDSAAGDAIGAENSTVGLAAAAEAIGAKVA